MSRQQRLVFAGIAAVIAVVAVIVLSGGDSVQPETAATPTPTPAATATTEAEPEKTPTPTPEPTPESVAIEIRGGKVPGGPVDVDVEQGERARFTVTSDVADHVHVHGYDIFRDVAAGGRARFDFKADITGVFEIELEDAGLEIARLRVEP